MKALVLCGGIPQIALVNELKQRGITVIMADMNKNAPAVKYADKFYPYSTLDEEAIERLAIEEHVDFVISVCADQMLLVAAKISEKLGLPCYIDSETAKNVSSKEHMKRIFLEAGIPTSKYIVRNELKDGDVEGLQFPLIVKPVDCYSSRGVRRVYSMDELHEAFAYAASISRSGKVIVEEYADGEEISVDCYVENGVVHVLCSCYLDKVQDEGKFFICRGRFPAIDTPELEETIRNVAQKIADAFHLVDSPMLIQMKIDHGKPSVIECCARSGGGIKYKLIPRVSGFDVVKAVVDLTLGIKPHVEPQKYEGYIVNEFLYCREGILDHVEGMEELFNKGIIQDYCIYKEKGHTFQSISGSGDRVAYFSVQADSAYELKRKHAIACKDVKAIDTNGKDIIRHERW